MDEIKNYDASADKKYEDLSSVEIIREDGSSITIGDKTYGKIKSYKFRISIRDEQDLVGEISREEMNMIYQYYSFEGANLTQRQICRHFPQYTLKNFRRILRAFNITKSCSPLAPHMMEEYTADELVEISWKSKESSYLRKFEQERERLAETRYKELLKETLELKNKLETLDGIKFDVKVPTINHNPKKTILSDKDLMIHLSDLHIGARMKSGSLYNNTYNKEVIFKRMTDLLDKINNMGKFNHIVINLLGDNLDGMDQKTARRDHLLPQNMDNVEQINTFIEVLTFFIHNLIPFANRISIYSVKCGNHDGSSAYAATKALFYKFNAEYPDIETKLFDEFFGSYKFKNQTWVITHGKDEEFMKRGLPLNLDEKSKIMIYEWLDSKEIYGNNIHIVKGDLHSDNYNSCMKFDYRNCLSFFGASDHSNYNYSRNNYGVSYELFYGDSHTRGSFLNI